MTAPHYIIGVCQQPEESFSKWKQLGVNTLVDIPAGREPVAWTAAATAAEMFQIREPVGDPATDAGNPYLLAWSFPDEPDLKGITPAAMKAARDATAKAAAVRSVPWFLNLAGGMVMNLVPNSPPQVAYQALMANADWIANDLYPIAGWDGAIDLFQAGAAVDRLRDWSGGKPQLMYVECSRQGLTWLKDGGRCVTQAELRLLLLQAQSRQLKGIIYFPLQPQSGFRWDASPPEIKCEMLAANRRLTQGY